MEGLGQRQLQNFRAFREGKKRDRMVDDGGSGVQVQVTGAGGGQCPLIIRGAVTGQEWVASRTVAGSGFHSETIQVSQMCLIIRTHGIWLNMGSLGLLLSTWIFLIQTSRGGPWGSARSNFPGDSYDQASLRTLISGQRRGL